MGDGLTLELLHVTPTAELLAASKRIEQEEAQAKAAMTAGQPSRAVNYPEMDAGVSLGEIDPTHDHTHLQLLTTIDGIRGSVDLTPYMERRARRYWRQPTDDWIERDWTTCLETTFRKN